MTQQPWDAIIIGGGPAGLSAALMLGRARRRVLVIDSGSPRNRFAAHMHGVLGLEGVPPRELRARGREECIGYGVEFTEGTVTSARRIDEGVRVTTEAGESFESRALIVASGLTDSLPDIPGLTERWGTTVFHCPYCHAWEFRDKRLAVLTTSPMSVHQAELIRQWSDDITLFTAALGELDPEVKARLSSRGIKLEPTPVAEIVGDGATIAAVRLADGRDVEVDAILTAGNLQTHEGFLVGLELERSESPFGSYIAVDHTGKTSDDRIWAVGNVVSPMANVPMSIGTGSFTGAAVNGALVGWDFDTASSDPHAWPEVASAEYWENRYAASERMWSGRVNPVLAEIAVTLEPGTAIDLGCGEGGDVIWLAQHGWDAIGIDVSPTAIARAQEAAQHEGELAGNAHFEVAELSELRDRTYDFVTASFLHSPAALPREALLHSALTLVAPGGHLLITSHTGFPPAAKVPSGHTHRFSPPEDELAVLELDPDVWEAVTVETRPRQPQPGQDPTMLPEDGVLFLRRVDV